MSSLESEKRIKDILENLQSKFKSNHDIMPIGMDLSFVDRQRNILEIFSYGIEKYHQSVEMGLDKIGSLLLTDHIFGKDKNYEREFFEIEKKKNHVNIKDDKYVFKGPVVVKNFGKKSVNATHLKWKEHHQNQGLHGFYFFEGKRKKSDFDIVLFGLLESKKDFTEENEKQVQKEFKKFLRLDAFSLIFERFRQSQDKMYNHALQAAVSSIFARNYAHHIGSHVKHRATLSKIRERVSNIYSF
jgi:hypothetical protein